MQGRHEDVEKRHDAIDSECVVAGWWFAVVRERGQARVIGKGNDDLETL